jgi:hypothetical protein
MADTDDIAQAVQLLEEQVRALYASGRLAYNPEGGTWWLDGEPADELTVFTVERLNVAGDLTRLRPLS